MTNTTERKATKRQCWCLFCITKKDYRNENLTYDEASALIQKLGDPSYTKKSKSIVKSDKGMDVVTIMKEAEENGLAEMAKSVPAPMVVVDGVREYHVEGDVCGFSWINFKSNTSVNRKFYNGLKKAGLLSSDINDFNDKVIWKKSSSTSGFTYWVRQGGQSLTRKEAFARGFNEVLGKYGIDARIHSRMD